MKQKINAFKLRQIPENRQVLITATTDSDYQWLLKQLEQGYK